MKVKVLVAQPCPALCNLMDCSLSGYSVHGALQARILEWIALPSSRGSSQPRDRTCVPCVSLFFTTSAAWEAPFNPYFADKQRQSRK